jgi:ABC-type branched-subunit amino acid transport system ATPase component
MTLDIQVAGLQLRYGAVTALDDLSFTLPGGRIYGLLGRNGSACESAGTPTTRTNWSSASRSHAGPSSAASPSASGRPWA